MPLRPYKIKSFNSNLPIQLNATFHSACAVNTMDTRASIETSHITASNAVAPTTVRRVPNLGNLQLSAPYAEDRILQIIKGVNIIATYSKATTPTD